MKTLLSYVMNVLFAADLLLCAACGGPKLATCSAYLYALEQQGKPWGALRSVIDRLSSPGHCQRAYEAWRSRANLPAA